MTLQFHRSDGESRAGPAIRKTSYDQHPASLRECAVDVMRRLLLPQHR
jgi:hypothetical protein